MNHMFPCLRLVVLEIYDFAFVIASVDRQLDPHLNIVVYHVQI